MATAFGFVRPCLDRRYAAWFGDVLRSPAL